MTHTSPSTPKKILVIDDNAGILFSTKEALKFKNYDVSTLDAYSGIDDIIFRAPDLMFLDISLVGHNGGDIARLLKGDPRTKHIPIVILTAYHNAEELAKEAGADDFLSKPFELQELWDMTATYTGQKV